MTTQPYRQKYQLFVVSSGRPSQVAHMQKLGLGDATWVVPNGEQDDYGHAGATRVKPVPSTQVTHQRQFVLEYGRVHGCAVVMVDDDLRKLQEYNGVSKREITVRTAADRLCAEATIRHAALAGVGPTDNAYFVKKDVHTDKYVRSALIYVDPNRYPHINYDHDLPVKEDYAFTMEHLLRDGIVVRVDAILASFAYKTNNGGCQEYRTPEMEARAVDFLTRKWPANIRRNSRRENEVLLRWKG